MRTPEIIHILLVLSLGLVQCKSLLSNEVDSLLDKTISEELKEADNKKLADTDKKKKDTDYSPPPTKDRDLKSSRIELEPAKKTIEHFKANRPLEKTHPKEHDKKINSKWTHPHKKRPVNPRDLPVAAPVMKEKQAGEPDNPFMETNYHMAVSAEPDDKPDSYLPGLPPNPKNNYQPTTKGQYELDPFKDHAKTSDEAPYLVTKSTYTPVTTTTSKSYLDFAKEKENEKDDMVKINKLKGRLNDDLSPQPKKPYPDEYPQKDRSTRKYSSLANTKEFKDSDEIVWGDITKELLPFLKPSEQENYEKKPATKVTDDYKKKLSSYKEPSVQKENPKQPKLKAYDYTTKVLPKTTIVLQKVTTEGPAVKESSFMHAPANTNKNEEEERALLQMMLDNRIKAYKEGKAKPLGYTTFQSEPSVGKQPKNASIDAQKDMLTDTSYKDAGIQMDSNSNQNIALDHNETHVVVASKADTLDKLDNDYSANLLIEESPMEAMKRRLYKEKITRPSLTKNEPGYNEEKPYLKKKKVYSYKSPDDLNIVTNASEDMNAMLQNTMVQKLLRAGNDGNITKYINWKIVNHGKQTIIIL